MTDQPAPCQYCQRTDCTVPDPRRPGETLYTCGRGQFHDMFTFGYDINIVQSTAPHKRLHDMLTRAHQERHKK